MVEEFDGCLMYAYSNMTKLQFSAVKYNCRKARRETCNANKQESKEQDEVSNECNGYNYLLSNELTCDCTLVVVVIGVLLALEVEGVNYEKQK